MTGASRPVPVEVVAPGPDPSEKTARVHLLDDLLKRLHPKKRTVLVLFEIEIGRAHV